MTKYTEQQKIKKKEYYQIKKDSKIAYQKNYNLNNKDKIRQYHNIYIKAMFIVAKRHSREFKRVIRELKNGNK